MYNNQRTRLANMNRKKWLVVPLVGLGAMLSSCMVDSQGRVWPAPVAVGVPGPVVVGARGVAVGVPGPVVVGPGYYGEPWGPYGEPYFVYGNLYYFNYHGRYCYYDHGRRVYVSHLPSGGHYYNGHDHRGYR